MGKAVAQGDDETFRVAPELVPKVRAAREALAAIEEHWDAPGIRIEINWALRFSGGGGLWRAEIYQERITASGRRGKPKNLIVLTADTSAELLRSVSLLLCGPEITEMGERDAEKES